MADEILTEFDFADEIVTDADFADAPPSAPRDYSLFRSEFASPQLPEGYGRGDLFSNKETGFAGNVVRSLPSSAGATIGGALGTPFGPPGVIAGTVLGGALGEYGRQGGVALTNPNEVDAKSAIYDAGKAGLVQGITAGAGKAAGALWGAIKPSAVKTGAQGIRALTGIPEKSGRAVLNDPSLLTRAAPIDEAGAAYASATQGLKSGAEAARGSLGKSYFTGDAIADKFDELVPKIVDGTIDTQTALALRQSTMKAIEDLPFKQSGLRRVLADNIDKLDEILETRLPQWPGARTGYRESKIAEDFSSWLPLNKNLSPNALRTTAAIAGAAKGLAEGRPWLALGLPLISPKVTGLAIRGAAAAAPLAAGVYKTAPSALEQAYREQRQR